MTTLQLWLHVIRKPQSNKRVRKEKPTVTNHRASHPGWSGLHRRTRALLTMLFLLGSQASELALHRFVRCSASEVQLMKTPNNGISNYRLSKRCSKRPKTTANRKIGITFQHFINSLTKPSKSSHSYPCSSRARLGCRLSTQSKQKMVQEDLPSVR